MLSNIVCYTSNLFNITTTNKKRFAKLRSIVSIRHSLKHLSSLVSNWHFYKFAFLEKVLFLYMSALFEKNPTNLLKDKIR